MVEAKPGETKPEKPLPLRLRRRRFDADHALTQLNAIWGDYSGLPSNAMPAGLNCNQAIDELILRLPSFGSLFYILVNGWYLGQWADYSSCLVDAFDA